MACVANILPVYSEILTIKKTIQSFFMALPSAKIIIVDNNSNNKMASMPYKMNFEFRMLDYINQKK
jgi:hypothetical protein